MVHTFLRYAAVAAFVTVVTTVVAACGGESSPASRQGAEAPAVLITVDGSSTVFPIAEAVAEEFGKANPNLRTPTVGISGTGGGFQKFCRGETDISNASRPIRPAEIEACRKAGVEYIEVPIAYDGLTIVVNPKNSWAATITVAELKTLWSPEAYRQEGAGNRCVRRDRDEDRCDLMAWRVLRYSSNQIEHDSLRDGVRSTTWDATRRARSDVRLEGGARADPS